jgi:hypothetical protein
MKLLFALLCFSAATVFAEEATLSANTVLRTPNSLVILKAGTTVQILARNDKTVTVKSGDKIGRIPWSALESYSDADMMSAPRKAVAAPAPVTAVPAPAPASPGTPPAHVPGTQVIPHNAQSTYGKMVEKAANAADSHEKALVNPTDEILGGK